MLKAFLKTLKISTIFILTLVWVFSGSSQIFSPRIKIAQADTTNLVIASSCDLDDVNNASCYSAISVDGGTSFAVSKSEHIDAQFQALSGADSINSVDFYYDSWATLSGTWGIYITATRDGATLCSTDPAPGDGSETNNSILSCSISLSQLNAGVWLYAVNNDDKQPQSFNLDYVRVFVDYNPLNSPPTITVNQPDGVGDVIAKNASYNITYDLADTDNVVTAAFSYDTNNTGLDGTAITGACATAAEGTGATCSWDTTGVTPGSYYVYGITDDTVNPAVNDYSSGVILINDPPTITVTQPDGVGDTVSVGQSYNITYDLADTDDVETVAFYYDTDAVGLNGTAITGACATAAEGTGATCSWDTTGVTPGDYYIYGITDDTVNPAVDDYSSDVITITSNSSPTLTVTQPNGASVIEGQSYNITYDLADTDDTVTVAFFYDDDSSGLNGNTITGPCATAAEGTGATCAWNTTGITGTYYVYGITDDGTNPQVDDYTPGTITISAQSLTFSINDNSIGFGTLSSSAERFATGDTSGSGTETSAHTLTASTNAPNGYIITIDGNTLTYGGNTINAIGASALDVNAGNGTEQFGVRMTASSGNGSVSSPYNGANNYYAFDDSAFPDQIASDPDGDDVATTYSVYYATNIANNTEAGNYYSTLSYIATSTF